MRYQLQLLGSYLPHEWADCESQPDETVAEACKRWLLEAHKLTNGVVRVKWERRIGGENIHDLILGSPLEHPGYTYADIRKLAMDLRADAGVVMAARAQGKTLSPFGPFATFASNLKIYAKALDEERAGRRGFTGGTLPTAVLSYVLGLVYDLPQSNDVHAPEGTETPEERRGNKMANFSALYGLRGPELYRAIDSHVTVARLAALLQEAWRFDGYPSAYDDDDVIDEALINDRSLWEQKHAELDERIQAALRYVQTPVQPDHG